MRNKSYAGQQAGVIVQKENGNLENRIGALVLSEEKLVGGWAKVFVKGYEQPIESSVSFEEYVGKKSDGTVNSQWTNKPATMIRKVALVQALREAFPEELQGLYAAEEMGINESELSTEPIDITPPEQPADPLA
jgi:phage recombination protein Bet